MSSAGLDYFANLNKYKGEATASMDTYRNHALEKVKEKNKGVQEKIDAVQKAGLGVSALGIAMKSINKQIPKEWLNYDAGNTKGYNFQDRGNHLHSTQMEKGGGDGLHYEVPEENFNSSRQPRPGDRMRSAIEPEPTTSVSVNEPQGIYERLTDAQDIDSKVSSTPLKGIEEETSIDDAVGDAQVDRLTQVENQAQADLDQERVERLTQIENAGDVEPNVIDEQQTYQPRGGSETGAGASENVMTEERARQFTQGDNTIYSDNIDSEIQAGEESEIQPAVGASRKPEPVDVENRIAGDTNATDVQNAGGSAITAEDQAKLDQLTDGATEAEDLLQQDKDAVGEVAGKQSATAGESVGEGAGESGGIAGDIAGETGDALLAEGGGEEAVAVGIDVAGMASGVGEAVGAALLLGSLAYELSQSSVMKGKEDTAEKAMPTQAASYGGADIQSSGATGRSIV